MNPDKTREAIKVMEAYAAGKQIQSRAINIDADASWRNINGGAGETPSWNWEWAEYRIAPPAPSKPAAPEDYWIVVSKASNVPLMSYTCPGKAKDYMAGYDHLYEIVHVKPVVEKKRPEKLKSGDKVVLARLSSEDLYDDDDGPGWDDELLDYVGKHGTLDNIKPLLSYTLVEFEDGRHWYIFNTDLDPA